MAQPETVQTTDIILVKRYILLPLILSAYERDQRIIKESGLFKTPDIYTELLEIGLNAVIEELRAVRKAFTKRGIKVYEEEKSSEGIRAEYLCRGYHQRIFLPWSIIKAECVVMMRKYLGLNISRFKDLSVPEDLRIEY